MKKAIVLGIETTMIVITTEIHVKVKYNFAGTESIE